MTDEALELTRERVERRRAETSQNFRGAIYREWQARGWTLGELLEHVAAIAGKSITASNDSASYTFNDFIDFDPEGSKWLLPEHVAEVREFRRRSEAPQTYSRACCPSAVAPDLR